MEEKKDENENRRSSSSSSSVLPSNNVRTGAHQCKICGDAALHSNYGAVTCSPCKMFFKRNAVLGRTRFRCDSNNLCEINIYNRHICPSCRLAKCFANGMQTELIRCPISRRNRSNQRACSASTQMLTTVSNILTPIDQPEQIVQLSTSTDLQSDHSAFDSTQWSLLTTLINIYDEQQLVSIAQRFIEQTQRMIVDQDIAKTFFAKIYEVSANYLRSNGDLCTVTMNDGSNFLRNAAECVTCLGSLFVWQKSRLNECQKFVEIFKEFYGEESLKMARRVLKFIDPDSIVAKLGISLFAFSNSRFVFNAENPTKSENSREIVRIQNSYAELTWKYLLYKYGRHQATRRWINLTQCFLAATEVLYESQTISKHVHDINLLVEETELSFVLDDIESADED